MAGPFNLTSTEVVPSHVGRRGVFVLENYIDFTVQNLANTEIINALNVYAGDRVLAVTLHLVTAEGAAGTIDIGDGSDVDGYFDAFDINGTPGYFGMELLLTEAAPNTVTGYMDGKLYTANDTIDILSSHANGADAAKLWIRALIARMGT